MGEDESEMQCRKLLLDFYSSQTNIHGSLIIGFSVVLFVIVQIRISPLVESDLSVFQNRILYGGIFLACLALYYLFLRCVSYGTLAHYAILTPWNEPAGDKTKGSKLESFGAEVSEYVEQKAGLKWLIRYFTTSTREGFFLASLLSLVTTFSLALVLDYTDFTLVLTVFLSLVSLGFCLFLFSKKQK